VNQKQGLALDSALTAQHIPHKLVFMKNAGHAPRFFSKTKETALFILISWNGLEDNLCHSDEGRIFYSKLCFFT
jgi:hypothetical protein